MGLFRVVSGRVVFWLSWPLLRVVLHGSLRTRVIIESENSYLVLRGWHDGNKWSLPGGGVRRKEKSITSALREVSEETGIRLKAHQLIDLGQDLYVGNGLVFTIQRYGCKLPAKPSIRKQHTEVIALEWRKKGDITSSMVDGATWRHILAWQARR